MIKRFYFKLILSLSMSLAMCLPVYSHNFCDAVWLECVDMRTYGSNVVDINGNIANICYSDYTGCFSNNHSGIFRLKQAISGSDKFVRKNKNKNRNMKKQPRWKANSLRLRHEARSLGELINMLSGGN